MLLMLPAMFLGMLQAMFIANDISLMDLQELTRTYKDLQEQKNGAFYNIKEPSSTTSKNQIPM